MRLFRISLRRILFFDNSNIYKLDADFNRQLVAEALAEAHRSQIIRQEHREWKMRNLSIANFTKTFITKWYPFRIHIGVYIIAWDEIPCYNSGCHPGNGSRNSLQSKFHYSNITHYNIYGARKTEDSIMQSVVISPFIVAVAIEVAGVGIRLCRNSNILTFRGLNLLKGRKNLKGFHQYSIGQRPML